MFYFFVVMTLTWCLEINSFCRFPNCHDMSFFCIILYYGCFAAFEYYYSFDEWLCVISFLMSGFVELRKRVFINMKSNIKSFWHAPRQVLLSTTLRSSGRTSLGWLFPCRMVFLPHWLISQWWITWSITLYHYWLHTFCFDCDKK